MFKNTLKTAWRGIVRSRKYSVLNIAGLATGLAACLLMAGFVIHELSYETMHPLRDRIYRINAEIPMAGGMIKNAVVSAPLGPAAAETLPEVEMSTRLLRLHNKVVQAGDREFSFKRCHAAEPGFFKMFAVRLVRGNPDTALRDPFGIVIDQTTARRLFGDRDPMGETLRMSLGATYDFQVTGIMEDIPSHTVLRVPLLVSFATLEKALPQETMAWRGWGAFTTFILLKNRTDPERVEEKIVTLARANLPEQEKGTGHYLQPFRRIYIDNAIRGMNNDIAHSGSITRVAVFSITAFLILVVAAINFINLSTAKVGARMKEVGVRKTCGAHRLQLVRQFLAESVLLTTAAMVLGLGLFTIFKPHLDRYLGMTLNIGILSTPWLLPAVVGMILAVGFLAGSYPALLMSRVPAAIVFRSGGPGKVSRSGLRRALVVVQFFIAVVLIAWTLVVLKQIRYSEMRDPGFDRNGLIVLKNPEARSLENAVILRDRILNRSGAVDASTVDSFPYARNRNIGTYRTEETRDGKGRIAQTIGVDPRFVAAMGLRLAAGRSFEDGRSADQKAVLLNEKAVEDLGLDDPVGRTIFREAEPFQVIGVVKDWNTNSIHAPILPVVLHAADDTAADVLVRLPAGRESEVIASLRTIWNEMLPGRIFDYSFVDELEFLAYEAERRLANLLVSFCLLTVFVAGLGIFGLSSYSVEQRTREIGIRKVLGLSAGGTVALFTKSYARWVLAANVVAWPVAWYAARTWLKGFAYRTTLGPEPFLIAGVLTLLTALASVTVQTLKAAGTDPAEALRYE